MQRLINLTFHGIGEAVRPLEPGEQNVWVSSEQFLGVLDAVACRDEARISFDDGNRSDVEQALPALHERGLTATFFVVAGRLGTPGFLDADDVRTLAAAGMKIGCHGMGHRPWRRLDQRALREELVDSKRCLEAIVQAPVTEAACPFGAYDRRALGMLRRCGYARVYTSDGGTAKPRSWIQPRNTLCRGDDAARLERMFCPRSLSYAAARRHGSRLVKRWR